MIPTPGRIVLYKLTDYDAQAINGRRNDGRLHKQECDASGGWQESIPVGNAVAAGDIYPLVITRVWGESEASGVNGQVLLDGNDTLWATSVQQAGHEYVAEGAERELHPERTWIWPPRV